MKAVENDGQVLRNAKHEIRNFEVLDGNDLGLLFHVDGGTLYL